MCLKIEDWKEIMGAVNSSNGNLLEQIKKMLKEQNKSEYLQWERKNFDTNHQFGALFTKEKEDDTCEKKLSLLHIAALIGNLDMAKALLEQGANVDEKEDDGLVPLHLAAEKGHEDIRPTAKRHGTN